ncbi:MAG: hypothetical protein V1736_09115 [Pseudomonadota bacterium]
MRRSEHRRLTTSNQNGFTLLGAIALMVCTSLVIVAGWNYLDSSFYNTGFQEEQALYVAQAGMDATLKYIEAALTANPDWGHSWPLVPIPPARPTYDPAAILRGRMQIGMDTGTYEITFTVDDYNHVTVQSTGEYQGCRRAVSRGLTRIARGSNWAVYSGNAGGFNLNNATSCRGYAYTNGVYNTQPGNAQKVLARVYRGPAVGGSGRARKGITTLPAARPVIAWELNNSFRAQRAQFEALIAAGPWPGVDRLWAGVVNLDNEDMTDTTPGDGNVFYRSLATPNNAVTLVTNGRPINVITRGSLSMHNAGHVIVDANTNSHVNIIVQNDIPMNQQAQFQSWDPGNPMYIYCGGQITCRDAGPKFNAPYVRVMCNNFVFTQALVFGQGSRLTLYAFGPTASSTTNAVQVIGFVILDDRGYIDTAALASSFVGIIYSESQTNWSFRTSQAGQKLRGSIISNSLASCTRTGNANQIGEDLVWIEPETSIMPVAVGYNPMNTANYSRWRELR